MYSAFVYETKKINKLTEKNEPNKNNSENNGHTHTHRWNVNIECENVYGLNRIRATMQYEQIQQNARCAPSRAIDFSTQ